MSLCVTSPEIGYVSYVKTGFGFLDASLKTKLVRKQCNPISFSCFVENNSKTAARVVAVSEICMYTATIN